MIARQASRFQSEARAIAAINHPHICQIYDVGSDYLVLEYLQGEPLRGPVTRDEAVRLAIQIADALQAAHERGILHRDLKPANVMVLRQGGRPHAKLLDFGIAQLTGSDPDATSTVAGDVIGTPAYMSPEQAAGKPLDARSDVFSFGAVLYELLAGARAFPGDSTAQILSAVLRDDPGPFDAPPRCSRSSSRCLAKDPERRFQTMADVRHALQHLPRGSADAAASIAVLPFANLSADRENEYFGDGLAEEIINALAQVDGLKVIARTSAFSFKGKNEDVRQIAQALGVTNVLEGSVRRAGDRIRVTAQLIAAADGTHLWSERFDRPMTDVFAMQDEIASAITTALKGRLGGALASPRHYTPRLDGLRELSAGPSAPHPVHAGCVEPGEGPVRAGDRARRGVRRPARRARAWTTSSAACTGCGRCAKSPHSSARRLTARWRSIRRIRGRGFCWAPSRWLTTTTGRRRRRISPRR